jgi:hypothetical protein
MELVRIGWCVVMKKLEKEKMHAFFELHIEQEDQYLKLKIKILVLLLMAKVYLGLRLQ